MCFEQMYDSLKRSELILVDGGMCRFHRRKDHQITIHEIISTRPGVGATLLERLKAIPSAASLLAKCPADLPSNEWYQRRGFILEATETTRSGRILNVWRLNLQSN